jgi:HEPN domain-containing protein
LAYRLLTERNINIFIDIIQVTRTPLMQTKINTWLNIALNDLESAILLHRNGKYRNSYFLFQQASEKANKAAALFSGDFTEKEIEETSHDQFRIPRKIMVQKEEKMKAVIELLESYPMPKDLEPLSHKSFAKHHKSISAAICSIDSLKNCDLVNFTLEDLDGFLEILTGLETIEYAFPENSNSILRSQMQAMARYFGELGTKEALETKREILKMLADKKKSQMYFQNLMHHLIPIQFDSIFIDHTFYFCALLTIQHSSQTRYPKNGVNPEDIYTKELPIVQKQLDFIKFLKEAILRLEKMNGNKQVLQNLFSNPTITQ